GFVHRPAVPLRRRNLKHFLAVFRADDRVRAGDVDRQVGIEPDARAAQHRNLLRGGQVAELVDDERRTDRQSLNLWEAAADARRAARARAAATTATGTGPVAAGGRGRSGAVCTAARRSVLPAVRLATAGEEGGATQERDQDPGKSSRRNKHWSGSLARRSGG